MEEYLLTFEYDEETRKIEIHADRKGLIVFKDIIDNLLEKGGDIHLMSPSWGGQELSEEQQNEKTKLLHHVKIFFWK